MSSMPLPDSSESSQPNDGDVTEGSFTEAYAVHGALDETVRAKTAPLYEQMGALQDRIRAEEAQITRSRAELQRQSIVLQRAILAQYAEAPESITPHDFLLLHYGALRLLDEPILETRFAQLLQACAGTRVGQGLEILVDCTVPGHTVGGGSWHQADGGSGQERIYVPENTTQIHIVASALMQQPQITYSARNAENIVFHLGKHSLIEGEVLAEGYTDKDSPVPLPLEMFLERVVPERVEGLVDQELSITYHASVTVDGVEVYGNPTQQELEEDAARVEEIFAEGRATEQGPDDPNIVDDLAALDEDEDLRKGLEEELNNI